MKIFKPALLVLLTFNIVMVILTVGLSKQAQINHPMMGSIVELDGQDMHVIDSGQTAAIMSTRIEQSEAIVLVHGASTSALDFRNNLLPKLSERHRVIAIDRPGHGYSDRGPSDEMHDPKNQAKAILDTLASMQVKRPVIVGHSAAGAVVLAALLDQHEKVSPTAGVVIAGVTHPWERDDSLPTSLALKKYYGLIFRWQYITPIGRAVLGDRVAEYFDPEEVPENYIHDTGLYLSLRPTVYLYNALDRSNLSEHLKTQSLDYGNIKVPVLSIAASEDHVVPPYDHHDKLVEQLDTVKAMVIEEAGHVPHHTRTDEVVEAINSFIDEVSL